MDKVSSSPVPETEHRVKVLVDGATPLTQEMVDRFYLLFEWLLDAPTTQSQRQLLHDWMFQAWKTNNRNDIQNALNIVNAEQTLEQRTDSERELIRQQLQAKLLTALRQKPDEPASKWVLDIYDAAHKPIAPGKPPLTRQSSDAYCEVLIFMRNEVMEGPPLQTNAKMKDIIADGMSKNYAKSSEAWMKHLAGMPLLWAQLRSEWPRLAEADRGKYRAQFRDYLKANFPEALTVRPAAPAPTTTSRQAPPRDSNEAYQREMARMQASHSAYMFMSNMSTMSHVATMNAIGNIGNSGWHYEYRYHH